MEKMNTENINTMKADKELGSNIKNTKHISDHAILIDALMAVDERMKECIKLGLSAHEAYDSFYKEIVEDAIKNAK